MFGFEQYTINELEFERVLSFNLSNTHHHLVGIAVCQHWIALHAQVIATTDTSITIYIHMHAHGVTELEMLPPLKNVLLFSSEERNHSK